MVSNFLKQWTFWKRRKSAEPGNTNHRLPEAKADSASAGSECCQQSTQGPTAQDTCKR